MRQRETQPVIQTDKKKHFSRAMFLYNFMTTLDGPSAVIQIF